MASDSARLAAALRQELCERARRWAEAHRLPHAVTYGTSGIVVFAPHHPAERGDPSQDPDGVLHGNFVPASYRAICRRENWRCRLDKVHTTSRSSLPRTDRGRWRELDTCTSSDALLMNIFCYPGVLQDRRVCGLLGVDVGTRPEFGVPARVPLANGHFDRTEVDMRLGSLLAEAKLTEADFQTAPITTVAAYRDFDACFQRSALVRKGSRYANYQLIRNVLAAEAMGTSLCVLADARRPDLIESWYATMRAVRTAELRTRCQVLTWQELAAVLPPRLQKFLDEKYGIGNEKQISLAAGH